MTTKKYPFIKLFQNNLIKQKLNPKILKYTDYKIKQGTWLQREYQNITIIYDINIFCIEKYINYLMIIGYKDLTIYAKIEKLKEKINSYNENYDPKIYSNIDELMDLTVK